jgi:hypothetical protein
MALLCGMFFITAGKVVHSFPFQINLSIFEWFQVKFRDQTAGG